MNIKTALSVLCLIVACGLATGCDKPSAASAVDDSTTPADGLDKLFPAPQFTLTDQDNQPFGTDQLKGKTWIATLFYSTCPGPCPMVEGKMHSIQDAVNDPNVLLVSISIDPNNDTPAKLKAYADRMDANAKRWYFLTGSPDQIKTVAAGLNLAYEPATADKPIVHGTQLLLIDKTGEVRGIYHPEDDASLKQLTIDAVKLSKES